MSHFKSELHFNDFCCRTIFFFFSFNIFYVCILIFLLLILHVYSFRQRDRIGVVGPNGVGKSTFLKVLTGSLELAAGSVRLGDTVRIGYYEQVSKYVTCQTCQTSIVMYLVLPAYIYNDINIHNFTSSTT